ncbi:SUN domain-containing protein 3-like isoform X2 [Neopsephotus bourkii]|uniref:SUN domain-containing protein 3-like isoform X2 n=1 Tax=Neopsephotus bourkii TaxID=309878 RepID=UPI002AA53F89|nr:SUN domain-containing protein 3-like isoform X2 [Neopsephotus bourkii]
MSGPHGSEQELLGNLEASVKQELQDFKQKVTQVASASGRILQIVRQVLKDRAVQEEQIEEILQLAEVSFKKVLQNYVVMPDWALESMGASIDEERTSKTYGGQGMMTWLLSLFTFSFANPPVAILQPSIIPGDCWPFQGSQGHVVIRLPQYIQPTAFTVWHISKAVSPSGEVVSAPREFTVLGVDEAMAETVLGTFTYDVHKEIAQTFYVQLCFRSTQRSSPGRQGQTWLHSMCQRVESERKRLKLLIPK